MINILPEKRIPYILLTVSLIMISIGVYQYNSKTNFLKSCRLIKCKVTHIEENENKETVYTLNDVNRNYPQFTYTEKYNDDDKGKEYELNKLYDFYYYPKDPQLSEPKDFQSNYKAVLIFFAIGFVFMVNFSIKYISDIFKEKKAAKAQGKNF